ncbi:general transcriptional corepressor trfA [Bicyclus anynana]|uniref:General transcriptional corepressor trfA n=1 Tax=Bicyclus anynana TaxID=110368 RepID=A0ABM3LEN1_BICAN|nr:general transcriptional corepressor trfA [Bicyclus anynana]
MDMEVAGQWRRQWAGSAEYGKVTEGGVTRNVARAMEVLHASAPGARVRVVRAAYHSSAGPGAPAASYMMHSSRQVLSSGYNFLEPSLTPSKPLEISSTPLGSLPDSEVERENYKVTEPDDYDISEPSKWRGSSGKNSIRMPSEESSSADNASIIDLDSRSNSTFKRSLQSKHSEDKSRTHIINTRVSPLLDAPVALSTLKYTSILNNSDEWNNRRKSYSFEDTSPLDHNVLPHHTIDSSTDSGICKSTEIVDDPFNNSNNIKSVLNNENNYQDESFKQWLSRNRSKSYRDTSITPPRSYHAKEFVPSENKITLQSSGKVSITLPFESQKSAQTEKVVITDDSDRKTKRVEFCKTELHFAVDTGTVNIIATDEKPPPSNDFRRRRSAFVPLNDKVDRPITLFGEKSEFSEVSNDKGVLNECVESEENTAATKSILKNKIPKPKPYLLGENMVIGNSNIDTNNLDFNRCLTKASAVSLINSQLQSERRFSNETISSGLSDIDSTSLTTNTYRTRSKGPQERLNDQVNNGPIEIFGSKTVNKKAGILPTNSEVSKTKIRELRGRDLAYFGIDNNDTSKLIPSTDNLQEEIFHSVKLVQQVSNSVCNSEAESDDAPEYQNIPTKFNFNKVPTPSPRSKYYKDTNILSEQKVLKPISEQVIDHADDSEFRNSSLRRQKDPLKQLHHRTNESNKTKAKQCRQRDTKDSSRSSSVSPAKTSDKALKSINSNKENETSNFKRDTRSRNSESPLYVNVNVRERKDKREPTIEDSSLKTARLRSSINKDLKANKHETRTKSAPADKNKSINHVHDDSKDKKQEIKHENHHRLHKKHTPKRTEKLTTPDIIIREMSSEQTPKEVKKGLADKNCTPKLQRSESLKRNSAQNSTKINLEDVNVLKKKDLHQNGTVKVPNSHSTSIDHKLSTKLSKNAVTSHKIDKIPETKQDKSTKSKRSKYVINYDDKNGTVSSICKIKKGPGTYKRKMIEIDSKNLQESNTKEKSLNKIALRK